MGEGRRLDRPRGGRHFVFESSCLFLSYVSPRSRANDFTPLSLSLLTCEVGIIVPIAVRI